MISVGLKKEIIIVDDGSDDGTSNQLKKIERDNEEVKVIYHSSNQGKGTGLRSGFTSVTGDIVIIQDADLKYDPQDYPILLGPIIDWKADVVYGSRFLGGPHRVLYFWHYVGNRFLTLLSNALSNLNLSDMETFYKAFRSEILENMILKSDRFGFEPEFTMKVAKKGYRIYEVPISYAGRTLLKGKR